MGLSPALGLFHASATRRRAREILHTVFHLPGFRPGQEEVVSAALGGRDVIALFPTGAGKSLCYQLPALMLSGPTLVVSPLIALMRDQVSHLEQLGIPALCLDSLQDSAAQQDSLARIRQGWPRLIYVSPERLQSPAFQRAMLVCPPSAVVVDEAHCVAQWGDSFRPAYAEIGGFLQKLPVRPVVLAMTATADGRMRAQIAASLGMRHPKTVTLPILRPNLRYTLCTTLNTTAWIQDYVRAHAGVKGLVFCATRKRCETLAARLAALTGEDGAPIRAAYYHAGLEREERLRIQEAFQAGEYDVLAVTSAFGMGVDIPDVRYTVHDSLPRSMLDLAQQTGRAGRDGQRSECVLLLSPPQLEWRRHQLSRQRFEAKKDHQERLRLWKDWHEERRVLEALLSGRCIASEISGCFGRREAPCGVCSACARRASSGWLAGKSPIAPVPDLYHMDDIALRRWALSWERKALAHNLGVPQSRVLDADSLLRSARMGRLAGDPPLPQAKASLERLLGAMRTAR